MVSINCNMFLCGTYYYFNSLAMCTRSSFHKGPVHTTQKNRADTCTLNTRESIHYDQRSFWVCVGGKLGPGNLMIIVTSSF